MTATGGRFAVVSAADCGSDTAPSMSVTVTHTHSVLWSSRGSSTVSGGSARDVGTAAGSGGAPHAPGTTNHAYWSGSLSGSLPIALTMTFCPRMRRPLV